MGYYIDGNGKRVELFCERLYIHNMNLAELVLPENCTYCECQHNQLTKLIVNQKCKDLWCYNNNLTELIIPESCIGCYCSSNKLTSLIVPKNCKIYCKDNNIPYYIEKLLMSVDSIKMQLANNLQNRRILL